MYIYLFLFRIIFNNASQSKTLFYFFSLKKKKTTTTVMAEVHNPVTPILENNWQLDPVLVRSLFYKLDHSPKILHRLFCEYADPIHNKIDIHALTTILKKRFGLEIHIDCSIIIIGRFTNSPGFLNFKDFFFVCRQLVELWNVFEYEARRHNRVERIDYGMFLGILNHYNLRTIYGISKPMFDMLASFSEKFFGPGHGNDTKDAVINFDCFLDIFFFHYYYETGFQKTYRSATYYFNKLADSITSGSLVVKLLRRLRIWPFPRVDNLLDLIALEMKDILISLRVERS